MHSPPPGSSAGWYRSPDDPPNTHRYWDGENWLGDAEPIPDADERRVVGIDAPIGGAGRRIAARVIDLAVNVAVIILITEVIDGEVGDGTPSAAASITALVFAAMYEIGLTAMLGATVGKLVLGLRVVELDGTMPPSVGTSARRWGPNILTLVPVFGQIALLAILVLSLAWITSDSSRRSVFDRTGPTYVISVR